MTHEKRDRYVEHLKARGLGFRRGTVESTICQAVDKLNPERFSGGNRITDDLRQEARMAVWESARERGMDMSEMGLSLVYVIARRACIDYMRRDAGVDYEGASRRRIVRAQPLSLERFELSLNTQADHLPLERSAYPRRHHEVDTDLTMDAFQDALAHLPPKNRIIAERKILDDWTAQDIAEETGYTRGTVWYKWSQEVRPALAAALADYAPTAAAAA